MYKFTKEEFYKMFNGEVTMMEVQIALDGLLNNKLVELKNGYYSLTETGKFYADIWFPKEDDNNTNPTTH